MPLNGPALTALVFADHLTAFPTAVNAMRQNPQTGVPPHNVPQAFISALCEAYVSCLLQMTVFDLAGGTLATPPGIAPPAPITFPGGPAAVAQFIASQGWVGPASVPAAQSFVGNVLLRASQLSLVVMNPHLLLGAGVGVISPASNPGLGAAMTAALNAALPATFQATGYFGTDDVPGAPVNPTLAAQLPRYAAALGAGTATLTASVTYASVAGPTTPVLGVINSGRVV